MSTATFARHASTSHSEPGRAGAVGRALAAARITGATRPGSVALLQRKCACGGSAGSDDKCEACQQKEIGLQRVAAGPARSNIAPPIVHDVLRSPGQQLDRATRAFMEPRFGHDFSQVRIHTDAKAAESAKAVAAHAYTVGSDIVFGAGCYAPGTESGRRLFAHELAHVVQQEPLQRGGPLIVGPADDACERQAEGIAGDFAAHDGPPNFVRASVPMKPESFSGTRCPAIQRDPSTDADASANAVPASQGQPPAGDTAQSTAAVGPKSACEAPGKPAANPIDIITFANDVFTLNSAQRAQIASFVRKWNDDGTRAPVRLDGFASPPGTEGYNLNLSCSRALAVAAEMTSPTVKGADGASVPGIPDSLIRKVSQGETTMFGPDDQNRRVAVSATLGGGPNPVPKPDPVPVQPSDSSPKCGPDITSGLTSLMSQVDTYFRGLPSTFQKRRSCMVLDVDALLSGVNPVMAWDTKELFLPNTDFLDPYFHANGCGSPRNSQCDSDPGRHSCETPGTCGNTVVVGGKCMLAGTANYALYGKMFKLCNEAFSPDYPRWDMRAMIGLWKTVDWDDSDPPKAVASAAFDGTFPAGLGPAENRGACSGRCGVTYGGGFDFVWEPYKSR